MAAPPAQSDATSAEAAEWDAYVTKVLASAHEQPTRPGVAVAEFAAEADCELSLAEGERVQIVDGVELAGGWAVALKAAADGAITAKGLVPATYIDLDAAAVPAEAAAADAEEGCSASTRRTRDGTASASRCGARPGSRCAPWLSYTTTTARQAASGTRSACCAHLSRRRCLRRR